MPPKGYSKENYGERAKPRAVSLDASTIEGFVNSCLIQRFDGATDIPWFHKEWWRFVTKTDKFVALSAPRSHAKSTAITHAFVLASLLFREARYCLIIANTMAQAVTFLNELKIDLIDNYSIQSLFGPFELERNREEEIIVRFSDGYRFVVQVKGAEQQVRGLKFEGTRPDLVICDDLESSEATQTKERRDKFKNWFYGDVIPCMSAHGRLRIVGTILHMDSLLENLMPKENSKFTVVKPLARYSRTKLGQWISAKYLAHDEVFNNILWESKWESVAERNGMKTAQEALQAIRDDYFEKGIPEVYSMEYLNTPIDESTAFFKKKDLVAMTEADFKKKKRWYIGCDLAVTTGSRSDYSVFVIGGMDENGLLHIQDVIRDRMDSSDIVDTLLALQKKYDPEMVTLEKGQIEKSIGPFLRERMLKSNTFINLNLHPANKDKESRARSIQARLRIGGVRFNKDSDWWFTAEEEMLKFPRSRHDDFVDALAWLGFSIDKMNEGPTDKEAEYEDFLRKQEELLDEMDGDADSFDDGRNIYTGY